MHHRDTTTGDNPKVIARWNDLSTSGVDDAPDVLLLVATLNACLLQKLAVLLLRHPLATLLNNGAHRLTSLALDRVPGGQPCDVMCDDRTCVDTAYRLR